MAVWGWILTGALVAYERITREENYSDDSDDKSKRRTKGSAKGSLPPQIPLFATLGGLIGLIIALPPLSADLKWRSAIVKQTLPALEETMKISYFNPPNSTKYLRNIQTLEQSNLTELARKYSLEAVRWNPEVFDSWKALYFIQGSTPQEKATALENMKRLDPLNPDVTKP